MVKVQLLAVIVGYWLLLYCIVGLPGSPFEGDFSVGTPPNITQAPINVSGIETFFEATGNVIGNALSIAGFIFFGVGLPAYIPTWLATLFFLWNTLLSVVAIGVFVSFFISA